MCPHQVSTEISRSSKMEKVFINDGWLFTDDFDERLLSLTDCQCLKKIRLPHTVVETPFNSFSPKIYEKLSLYKKIFDAKKSWAGKKIYLTVEASAHFSKVYINGNYLGCHRCGYTAFTFDLTDHLFFDSQNVLDIVVDSREDSPDVKNQPPFGGRIDYMTYGGIYREVYLEIKNPFHIEDVTVTTKKNKFSSSIKISGPEKKGCWISQKVLPSVNAPVPVGADSNNPCLEITSGVRGSTVLTSAMASGIALWTLENPALYDLETLLLDEDDNVLDCVHTRFGFRDIRFDQSGFYLNDKKIKLRGLNRHQSYPYVGYAMPKNMQRDDADILKFELGLNEVRTSHYPQSQHFVDRCDEIGLLVFTEIPGWQYIGGDEWKNQAVQNVRDMVNQYKNHPSVFMWGVRINESLDDDGFYEKTNEAARSLDKTRPTAGVRYLKHSSFFEDVYTFNDFSHTGKNPGVLHKKDVTKSTGGYMVTEYNGHMFPTKSFDCESHRTEHAIRHANVLESVAAFDEIGGSSGWCAFDYNTHGDFGSGDYICYHGVMDQFRNPKPASDVYRSQGEPDLVGDVLTVTSSMDIGEYPGGLKGPAYIITNCDSVKVFIDDIFIKEYKASDSKFRHLNHGPILLDDCIGDRLVDEEGYSPKVSKKIKRLLFAAQQYGLDNIPLKYKISALNLMVFNGMKYETLVQVYGKYIGNWGGEANVWKFEGYKNGKIVRTVKKCPGGNSCLRIDVARTNLVEDSSYDVSLVRFSAVDENGNLQPYCQESLSLKCDGAVELIGPESVSLKGGLGGCFVKTVGKSGDGSLVIKDWWGKKIVVDFHVEKK